MKRIAALFVAVGLLGLGACREPAPEKKPKGESLSLQPAVGEKGITDAELKEKLAGKTNVHVLFLNNTQVTDAGLKKLAGLPRLVNLGLGGTQVSDAGLKELHAFPYLTSLY